MYSRSGGFPSLEEASSAAPLAPRPAGPPPMPLKSGPPFDFKRLFTAFKHRWPLLVLFAVIGLTWGFTQYSLIPKMYKTDAILQIERKRLLRQASGQRNWLEEYWNTEYYPTQYTLLMSRGMAEEVVGIIRQQEIDDPTSEPRPAELLRLLEGDVVSQAKRLRGGVAIKPIRKTQLIELSYRSGSPEWAARVANAYAEAFIAWNRETRVTTAQEATQYLEQQIQVLREDITRKQMELNAYTRDNNFVVEPTSEVNRRRQALEKQYSEALGERIHYETKYLQLLDLPPETLALQRYPNRVVQLREGLKEMQAEYESKLKLFRPEWPTMIELQEKLERGRKILDDLSREAKTETLDEAYALYQKKLREEEALEDKLRSFRGETPELHAAALEYRSLEQMIAARRDLLADLVKRISETELVTRLHDFEEAHIRVVDSAMTPRSPYQPNLQAELSRGAFGGILLSVLLILALELLDRSVKSPNELERLLQLPILAVMPDISEDHGGYGLASRYRKRYFGYTDHGYFYGYGEGSGYRPGAWRQARRKLRQVKQHNPEESIELLPHYNPRMGVCEAYRSLRTALMLSSAETLEVVAITSAEPGEGKTVTTANLAVVMAQLDRKVLVIDADLRRPRMHQIFGVSNRHGLVSYLTGGQELDNLVLDTLVPNLWLCPSGPIPPNPSELLASERMRSCLDEARQHFDFILLDTPPALPVADAVMLGHATDGLIVCARAGMVQRDVARSGVERLRQGQVKILGAVLNCYRSHPRRYYKPYQYYGVYEESSVPPESEGPGHGSTGRRGGEAAA